MRHGKAVSTVDDVTARMPVSSEDDGGSGTDLSVTEVGQVVVHHLHGYSEQAAHDHYHQFQKLLVPTR